MSKRHFLSLPLAALLSAAPAFAQVAEIVVLPTPTPPARTTTTTVTTVTTTTTTGEAPPADAGTAAAPAPDVAAGVTAPTAPLNEPAPAPGVWIDDGSMDTASQVERTRRNLRAGMAADPWLAGLVNRISLNAQGESITLTGEVNHSQEREAIERITRDAAGNLRVINSIRVR